ncbi:MAG TPA: hypothetical protein DCQ06_06555, partial [Myxococcales bacterium]|nr:hypothetical protein [Myxococcales bacterium]
MGRCGEFDGDASCNCDDQCAVFNDCCDDYDQVCKVPSDASSGDVVTPDVGGTDATADASAGDDSCKGLCGKYTPGKACQCDSGCTQFGDCCKDFTKLCSTPDCQADADCDDKLACTADKCEASKCVNTPATGQCAIEGACYKDGDADANSCLVCKP